MIGHVQDGLIETFRNVIFSPAVHFTASQIGND